MKLIGLLSWYDEPERTLAWCVQALAQAGVDHLVAVDGRYSLFPGDDHLSPVKQHAVIATSCREYGMGLTLEAPCDPWEGNEVEKRTVMFALALIASDPGDWFWVMDADQIVREVPPDFKQRLADTPHDAAEVRFEDPLSRDRGWSWEHNCRDLFRAQPIHLDTNHYTYVASLDDRILWEGGAGPAQVEALDLSDCVVVEHRQGQREHERQQRKSMYYTTRDSLAIERKQCERCDRKAAVRMPVDWQRDEQNPGRMWSAMMELCEQHAEEAQARNEKRLRYNGIDPVTLRYREAYTPPSDKGDPVPAP